MRIRNLFIILLVFCFIPCTAVFAADVWEVNLSGEITQSQATWLEETYADAKENDADEILLVLDTPGGRIDSALEISKTISSMPTTVLVDGGAISAGVLIAFSAEEYYMLEGSTIGAAEPRIGSEKADEKVVSYWSAQLAASAEKNGRDQDIARAMADEDIEIEGVTEKGKLLTLTSNEALELEMTDGVYKNKNTYIQENDIDVVKKVGKDSKDLLADFLTSSVVSTILLMIGLAGIFIELFTPGFGVPGGIGIVSLGLYFGGSMLAGLSGWEAIFLFLLGIILLIAEVFFIPGFGVAGVGGLISIFASVFFAAPDPTTAIQSILIAFIGAIVIFILLIKILPSKKAFSKIILQKGTDTESGYIAVDDKLVDLVGKTGIALSNLRPAGTAIIEGEHVDVVTKGEFLPEETKIKVSDVVGARVIVEELKRGE